jgi:hypothetical protein
MTSYGTRWQSYCWPCKTFWDNRIEKSGIPNRDSRIPDYPEQHRFLEYWYRFYLGLSSNDGTELISGEAWRDVDVGCLPRTTFEIIHQSPVSYFELEIVGLARATAQARAATQTPLISVQDALDQLLEEVEEDEEPIRSPTDENNWYQPLDDPIPTYSPPRDTSDIPLMERLNQITDRFRFSTLSLDQESDDGTESIFQLPSTTTNETFRTAPSATVGRSATTRERIRAREPRLPRFEPRWGIDESPIRDMLMMASGRTRPPAESTDENFETSLQTESLRNATEDAAPDTEAENDAEQAIETQSIGTQATTFDEMANEIFRRSRRRRGFFPRRHEELLASFDEDYGDYSGRISHGGRRFLGLDDPGRPTVPATEEEKMVKMECSVCYDQKATVALFPCGHAVMCEWYGPH